MNCLGRHPLGASPGLLPDAVVLQLLTTEAKIKVISYVDMIGKKKEETTLMV